jgi:polyhydroxyalkanoate synthase
MSTPGRSQQEIEATAAAELADLAQRCARTWQALSAAAHVAGGCSARDAVHHEDKLTLYRYRPIAPAAGLPPVLIVYALVNRPHMLDLQPDRSLLRRLLELGIDVYLVDWGYPDGADRYVSLDDYINGYLHRALGVVLDAHRVSSTTLLGVCQGGTFSLCYAALHPERVRNLVTMVTPVDFHTPDNLLARWLRGIDVDALVEAHGVVPGEVLNAAYLSLMPFRLLQQKYVKLLESDGDAAQAENFMRMEKWIFDSPAQAGTAFREFANDCFRDNLLAQGRLAIGGRRVDLRRITQPLLNVYGLQDHLVPPAASRALAGLTASRDYRELALDLGHIGMYVSGRAQKELPGTLVAWLHEHP